MMETDEEALKRVEIPCVDCPDCQGLGIVFDQQYFRGVLLSVRRECSSVQRARERSRPTDG